MTEYKAVKTMMGGGGMWSVTQGHRHFGFHSNDVVGTERFH